MHKNLELLEEHVRKLRRFHISSINAVQEKIDEARDKIKLECKPDAVLGLSKLDVFRRDFPELDKISGLCQRAACNPTAFRFFLNEIEIEEDEQRKTGRFDPRGAVGSVG